MGSGGRLGFMQIARVAKVAILATKLNLFLDPLDYKSAKNVHRKELF